MSPDMPKASQLDSCRCNMTIPRVAHDVKLGTWKRARQQALCNNPPCDIPLPLSKPMLAKHTRRQGPRPRTNILSALPPSRGRPRSGAPVTLASSPSGTRPRDEPLLLLLHAPRQGGSKPRRAATRPASRAASPNAETARHLRRTRRRTPNTLSDGSGECVADGESAGLRQVGTPCGRWMRHAAGGCAMRAGRGIGRGIGREG